MTPKAAIRSIFEMAPDAHLLKIEPDDKCPKKGSLWRKHPLSQDDAIAWIEAGHRLGIVPATANAAVVDIDNGGEESLNFAKSICGDPVQIIETGSHTPDSPRWHCIYSHDPAVKIGNAKWIGGDLRVDAGYVVVWDMAQWADAIAKIAVQAIPPAPIAKLKTARPTATGSPVIGFQIDEGLHPRALEEIGRSIRESDTWDECVERCKTIVAAHIDRRKERDGDNAKTEEKLKSEIDAWNKAIPKWWKEKETNPRPVATETDENNYKLLDRPFVSSYGLGSPGRLLKEACAALGIRFRTNITRNIQEIRIDGFTLDRNGDTIWQPIEAGIESTLSMILEWNVRYIDKKGNEVAVKLASTNASLKDYIGAELHRNQYHPFKEWLDKRPEWDGIERITSLLDYLGLEIDIDKSFREWAHSYLVIEPIRLNLFPGSERKTHLVLSGGTNAGKSQLPKRLFPEYLANADYQNEAFVFCSDKTDQMYQVLGYIVCEGAEFTGGDIQSIRQAKQFLSQPGFGGGRVRYERRQATGYRTDCIYFSTNDKAPLPPDDPAMDGRLIIAVVRGACDHDGQVAFPVLDQLVDQADPKRGTIRDQIWAEAYKVVLDALGTNTVVRNPYLPQHELATKAQEWNAFAGAHYSTEQTTRREVLQIALDDLGNPARISIEELYEAMYRAETGESVVKIGDKPDYTLDHYKRSHKRHQVINVMKFMGYRWARCRYEGENKWMFSDGTDMRKSEHRNR